MKTIMTKRAKAFTLIELFLVIVIIAILATASAPFYSRFVLQVETANTADSLASTLRKAQSYAMAGKNDSTWTVEIAGGQIRLLQDTGSVMFDHYTLNSNITITGFSAVTFAKTTGIPSQAPTVNISGAGSSRDVSVNAAGVVNN